MIGSVHRAGWRRHNQQQPCPEHMKTDSDTVLRCCAAGIPEVLIATGGDDQALGVMFLSLESTRSEQKLVATVKGSVMLANAHSSAIKVIMLYPRLLFSECIINHAYSG